MRANKRAGIYPRNFEVSDARVPSNSGANTSAPARVRGLWAHALRSVRVTGAEDLHDGEDSVAPDKLTHASLPGTPPSKSGNRQFEARHQQPIPPDVPAHDTPDIARLNRQRQAAINVGFSISADQTAEPFRAWRVVFRRAPAKNARQNTLPSGP